MCSSTTPGEACGESSTFKDELAMIQLNAASVVAVTKLFTWWEGVVGRSLITASEASLAPIALMSIYQSLRLLVRAKPARRVEVPQ
jgi:short-subunit dehydrogenase